MFQERITRLTLQQRAFLAARLAVRENRIQAAAHSQQLTAWFVSADEDLTEERIREHAVKHLPATIVPRRFVQLSALPMTATGKTDRRSLAATPLPPRSQSAVPGFALSEIEVTLLKIWQEVLESGDVSAHDNFFHIGGDSLAIIRIIALSGEAGFHITPGVFQDHPTIAELATFLSRMETHAETGSSDAGQVRISETHQPATLLLNLPTPAEVSAREAGLLRLSDYSDKPALFLIPPKGVAVLELRHLVSAIRGYTCHAPITMEYDSAAHMTVLDLARLFVSQIRSVQHSGPYRLAGTCEGAYISWDIARLLIESGEQVSFLGIIDTPNPAAMRTKPLLDRIRFRIHTLEKTSVSRVVSQILKRAASWFRRRLKQTVKGEVHLTRAGSRMGWLFRAEPFAGHATLFRAVVPTEGTDFTTDVTHGWGELPQAGLDICSIPCQRLQMLQPPFAAALARRLEQAIHACEGVP